MQVEARVYRGNSGNYFVRAIDTGEDYVTKLRGNLKKDLTYSTSASRPLRVTAAHKRRKTDPITVGDRVMIDPDTRTIEAVLPRTSELSRLLQMTREQHVLVANLDTVFVVFAVANPRPDLFLLDKFLVMAGAAEVRADLIVNKCDLPASEGDPTVFDLYRKLGYTVHRISAKCGAGVDALRDELSGKIAAFTGPSGVGKSSLLNSIEPGLSLKTRAVGEATHHGRHTTTTAELIPLSGAYDTWVADTPGLRQLDLWEVESLDVELYFPEIRSRIGTCFYANCRHWTEDRCTVRAAVATREIDERRYRSYVKLSGGDTSSIAPAHSLAFSGSLDS